MTPASARSPGTGRRRGTRLGLNANRRSRRSDQPSPTKQARHRASRGSPARAAPTCPTATDRPRTRRRAPGGTSEADRAESPSSAGAPGSRWPPAVRGYGRGSSGPARDRPRRSGRCRRASPSAPRHRRRGGSASPTRVDDAARGAPTTTRPAPAAPPPPPCTASTALGRAAANGPVPATRRPDSSNASAAARSPRSPAAPQPPASCRPPERPTMHHRRISTGFPQRRSRRR
jgi:hypothetical protein